MPKIVMIRVKPNKITYKNNSLWGRNYHKELKSISKPE
jgi:hypothetical protein